MNQKYNIDYKKPLKSRCFCHCVISVRIRCFSGPYFAAFGLNTEKYGVSLRIQSECGNIRSRKTLNTDTFHTVFVKPKIILFSTCKKVFSFVLYGMMTHFSSERKPSLQRNHVHVHCQYSCSCSQLYYEKAAQKIFTKFIETHLSRSIFLFKLKV